ncbi:NAD(P)-dependent dehydrogenase (short-subunit alcohol dehydrogenase family) [Kaistia hirudinis]|mgnify:CR=1 FL=1|uniref:NAD(P)-dependent dehydrogenase (Short-subunit alcohol dehydrogenase family) n=1 Tax=Kaistia hirudinis TaxID=1293440 RepID=A0A840AJC3_9HYPH|nr:SDR family oxidoreductase [Kaistia hirudinis]MBB3929031.1 NAD(P)-dependent dehydrogenase (short-subunit alcohol dehydrogenase family) [Kaistia hirudinis]MBN9018944.1 SDR family oxidoreductase [Hyphomicrobiales bacterium]
MDLRLTGKKVLITGASQGIGAGLAKAFAEEGCTLALTARNAEKLAAIRTDILADAPDLTVDLHPLDLTEAGAAERLADAVGDVDILVNNAGVIPSGSLFDIDEAKWRAGWELKVFGYINLCRLYYPRMKAAGGGVIINNIGNGGEVTDPRYIAGAVGNASLMHFTRALGGSSLDDKIRVVGVNPGPVNTDRIYNMLKKRAKDLLGDENRFGELESTYPLGRPAHVHEVTDLIVFLASYRAGYITGTIVTVDGGIASRRSII